MGQLREPPQFDEKGKSPTRAERPVCNRCTAFQLEYMEKLTLAGVMLWSLDSDDFNGVCGTPWPLVTTVKTYVANSEV